MKAKIYKGREVIGTVEFKDAGPESEVEFDIKDKKELKKIVDIYNKPHTTLQMNEGAEIFTLDKVDLDPKTKRHFEVVTSELWKFGYGHEWE